MKRRRALGLIGLAAAGTVVFPSCEFTSIPYLKHFTLEKSQYKNLKALSVKVLPIPDDIILKNMSPIDFTLIMMDDCETEEDIRKFTTEMNAFFIENEVVSEIEVSALSIELENSFFLQKVKDYHVTYYKGLENYLTTYTDYEFIPGRFVGCAKV